MTKATPAEIHDAVRQHLAKEMPERADALATVDPEASLFELGYLDSLSFLGLVEFIEGRYGITVPPHDFAPARWRSLAMMSDYVIAAQGAGR
jgi:acyl carrier protein